EELLSSHDVGLPRPDCREVIVHEFFNCLSTSGKYQDFCACACRSQTVRLRVAKDVFEEHFIPMQRRLNSTKRNRFTVIVRRVQSRTNFTLWCEELLSCEELIDRDCRARGFDSCMSAS